MLNNADKFKDLFLAAFTGTAVFHRDNSIIVFTCQLADDISCHESNRQHVYKLVCVVGGSNLVSELMFVSSLGHVRKGQKKRRGTDREENEYETWPAV